MVGRQPESSPPARAGSASVRCPAHVTAGAGARKPVAARDPDTGSQTLARGRAWGVVPVGDHDRRLPVDLRGRDPAGSVVYSAAN